jgi:hypothetical protein
MRIATAIFRSATGECSQSCVDEDDAWELEQSLGLGSREILVVRVVEAVLSFDAPGPTAPLSSAPNTSRAAGPEPAS